MSFIIELLGLFIVIMLFGFMPGIILGAYLHKYIIYEEED